MNEFQRLRVDPLLMAIVALYLCIHGLLLVYDLGHPAALLVGDRSLLRMEKVTALLAAPPGSGLDVVVRSGAPGDYVLHAALFALGGAPLIIVTQLLVQLVTLVVTYVLARRLTGSARIAAASALLLMVMPGALMNAHLLATETWFAVFLTIGTLLLCLAIGDSGRSCGSSRSSRSSTWAITVCGFVALAAAAFVRPQGLFVPAAAALCLVAVRPRAAGQVAFGLAVCYALFPLSWIALQWLAAGQFGVGASDADLGTNLLIRANRMSGLPFDAPGEPLGLLAFLDIAAAHPAATLKTFYTDILNLVFNPGINHVFGLYLGLFDAVQDRAFWSRTIDQTGAVGVVNEILRQSPTFLAIFVTWAIVHALVLVGTAVAAVRAIAAGQRAPQWIRLVLAVVAVTIASALVAGLVRWAHRSGAEPLLALLVAWGLLGRQPAAAAATPARSAVFAG
jgi:hypothetical protein